MYPNKKILALAISSILLTACGGGSGGSATTDTDQPVPTPTPTTAPEPAPTFTDANLDATNASQPALFDLLSNATVTDQSWQIGYQKYSGFMLNGGLSGQGKVSGCIAHQYSSLFDGEGNAVEAEFVKLNQTNTVTDFNTVTADACSEFVSDSLITQIKTSDWLEADYSQGAPVYSAKADNGWIIRSASGDQYARVSVKQVTVAFGPSTTRKAVLSVANWDANAQQFSPAVDSPALDFSNATAYWDLETNALTSADQAWDLSIKVNGRDYPLQVNGGASGSGKAGVGAVMVANVNAVTDPTDNKQVYKYFSDRAEGILSKPGSYGPLEYSVQGQHKMWPTFTTYLIKDESQGDARLFKLQVVSNYGSDGALKSGNLVLRYQELN
ncbi:hypothetical protein K6Y31_19980 [Motilimonas cestriensis]|uniref:HmuY protein n=1 Tax=Motilimonas cestriensis TaxID=2742685 RepID=A0ABS8WFW0_9GAMM|nr:HmuY family protein [Motilimonas cestriensis]MCE2597057.1 hypothetical protein [Motilimonas cestriensis]